MQLRLSASVLALVAAVALPGVAQAQGRDVYRLPMPTQPTMTGQEMGRAQPGVAASSPIGFGPSKGDIFAGFGYSSKGATAGESDGTLSVGGGFFNPQETVGLEAVLTSLSTIRSGFGSRMSASLKLHKAFANNVGVGLGIESIAINGGDETDVNPAFYVAASQVRTLRDAATFNQATFNLGIGNERFGMDYNHEDWDGESSMGVFLSAALRLNWASSAIVDYSGGTINLAASFAPIRDQAFVITPAITDVSSVTVGGRRITLAAGFSWKY
jgi:hypothetical protein